MKKRISAKLAGNILLAALGLLAIFHVLVLLRSSQPTSSGADGSRVCRRIS
ncbi:MAG TPA: hypothetical protein VFS61_13115 [Anaerolineales bacterium]|nr:hypothetical protein [Anaerolineales bacterium]